MVAIERELAARGWLGFERESSPEVERSVLAAVHPDAYVSAIEAICARGGGALDADTLVSRGSCTAALHAAGGQRRPWGSPPGNRSGRAPPHSSRSGPRLA
ncbi:hypothetical protein B4Q13_20305 [Lacticaseibacillus rhamnosus]